MPNFDLYQQMWDNMVINDEKAIEAASKRILEHKETYQEVVLDTPLSWQFVGVIHYRESNLDFTTHLHNGDSLKSRTKNVPAGRPFDGKPPFTWQESAKDALFTLKKLDTYDNWDLPHILYQLECFNGLGYKKSHSEVNSPYLWSGTNYYEKGKYASDGKFDSELVDKQIGTVPLFKFLTDKTLGLV